MPKKSSLFEVVLTALGVLTKTDTEGHVDSLTVAHIRFIEMLLKKAPLSKTERQRADAALYKALKAVNERPHDDQPWDASEVSTMPIPGDSAADKKLQGIVQGFKDRRTQSAAPIAQNL